MVHWSACCNKIGLRNGKHGKNKRHHGKHSEKHEQITEHELAAEQELEHEIAQAHQEPEPIVEDDGAPALESDDESNLDKIKDFVGQYF